MPQKMGKLFLFKFFYILFCRTLPLFDDIAVMLLDVKEKQKSFQKAFGNSYNKKYLNYVFVKPDGNIIRPDMLQSILVFY